MAKKIFQNVEVQGSLNVTGTHGAYVKLPVLTTAQRDALAPITGKVIYNSTTGRREVYNGTAWENIEDGAIVEVKLGAEAVTKAKVGPDAIDGTKIEDDAVDSEHIVRDAIGIEHLSDETVQELTAMPQVTEVRANEKYGLANIELR